MRLIRLFRSFLYLQNLMSGNLNVITVYFTVMIYRNIDFAIYAIYRNSIWIFETIFVRQLKTAEKAVKTGFCVF